MISILKKSFCIFILIVFISCVGGTNYFKWNDFSIDVLDNSGLKAIISNSDSINKKAFGFRINLKDTVYLIILNHNPDAASKFIRTNNIKSIEIRTINDYSNKYPANSIITDLFKSRLVDDFSGDYSNTKEIIDNVNSHDLIGFDMYLMDTSCIANTMQIFEINILLSDSVLLTKQTRPVILY